MWKSFSRGEACLLVVLTSHPSTPAHKLWQSQNHHSVGHLDSKNILIQNYLMLLVVCMMYQPLVSITAVAHPYYVQYVICSTNEMPCFCSSRRKYCTSALEFCLSVLFLFSSLAAWQMRTNAFFQDRTDAGLLVTRTCTIWTLRLWRDLCTCTF